MATEQELQLEYEYAKAKALAEQENNSKLDAEAKAQAPAQALPSHADTIKDYSYAGKVANSVVNPSGMTTGIAKGVANAGIGAIKTAQAVGNSIGSYLGDTYDEYAPSVGLSPRDPEGVKAQQAQVAKQQEALGQASFKAQTKEDQIWMPVGQVGAGMAAGGAVGKIVGGVAGKVLPNAGKIATAGKYLASGLGSGMGAAATTPEQDGLVVSSHGYVGFKINPDDDPQTQQSKRFINQALDNMVLGAAGDGALAIGSKVGEWARNIAKSMLNHGDLPKMQQQAAEDIVSVYAQLGEHPTAAQQQNAAKKVMDLIDKHGSESFDFGPGVGKQTVKKDSISVLTSGLDENDPFDRAVATRMEALRASAKRGKAPQTAVQLDEPSRVLNEGMKKAQVVRGGDQAIDQTKQVLQDRAMTEASQLDVPVQNAKDDLIQQSADYTDVLKKDPTFGPSITKAEQGGIPLDVTKQTEGLKNQIVNKSKAALETDRNIRNAAYKAVADTGAPANMDQFKAVYDDVADTLPEDIKKTVEGADGTYGYLHNQLRNKISAAIGRESKKVSSDSLPGLYALKKEIDEGQIDWLTGKGGPFGLPVGEQPGVADMGETVKQAAENAKKVNTEYSAKWKDTIGDELRVNFDKNRRAPGSLQEKGRDLVDAAISNPNRTESIDNLRNILGPDSENLIPDTAISKATEDITAGKGANFDKITEKLQQYANSFGPKQKARLEGFLTDLRDKKMSLEELGAKIPELERTAAAEKEELFGKRFPTLFENVGGKQVPQGNGYDVFNKAMDSQQPRVIEALIKEASKNPDDMAGLQTAWLKSAEGKINDPSKQVGKLDDQFVKYGKQIFGEDSPEVKSVIGLRDMAAKLEASLNRPGMEGLSAKENQTAFRTALSTVQTWVFGVLNPTAARVRTITSNLAEAYSSVDKGHQAVDTILADNQELRSAMEKMIYNAKTRMSPAMWKGLWEAGARMGVYSARSHFVNDQTNKAMRK